MTEFCALTNLELKSDSNRKEPQSDEEVQINDERIFEREIVKEIRNFKESIKNLEIVCRADIEGLKSTSFNLKSQLEQLGRFKDKVSGI